MNRPVSLVLAALLLLASDRAGAGASTTHLVIGTRSTLLLNGSSNVASWRCTGRTLTGAMEVAASIEKINDVIDHVEDGNIARWMNKPEDGRFPEPRFELAIPIDTLRCSGGRRMESDLKRALKANQFPAIAFHFAEVSSGVTHDIDQHEFQATIRGGLSLAGVTRDVSFPAAARRLTRTQFHLTAELPVRMSNFGVTPPTALLGIVKSVDALSVRLDLMLEVTP